jgi:hypothetical protein
VAPSLLAHQHHRCPVFKEQIQKHLQPESERLAQCFVAIENGRGENIADRPF